MKLVFSLLFCAAMLTVTAQESNPEFIRELDFPVYEQDGQLLNPWAGGLNYLQYSKIDLNGDGTEDLFIFDKSCHKVLTFLNEATEVGEINYKYAPEYEKLFPEGMRYWVLLRDYNCDGLKDVFTFAPGGIKLYEQVNADGEITFEAVYDNLLPSLVDMGNPTNFPVYNISVDLPHIGDIDGDGDVDILTFSDASLTVFYYINNASELDRCDTMALELANRCYGFIAESSENNSIFLEHICDFNVVNPRGSDERPSFERDGLHTGGTLLSLETNGDGKPELVIGDISNDSLTMVTNSVSVQGPDSMVAQANNFPANISSTEPVNFYEFPGAYYEDINNDGVRDLMSSSFSIFNSADDFSSWLYLNNGDEEFPDFELIETDWLQNDMIEHGTGSLPVIFDYNQDGLGDLIVGHEKTIMNAQNSVCRLRVYENIGTLTEPAFELREEDWLNLSSLNLNSIYPTFGDLDNDGDFDMILGESLGSHHYFENTAGAGQPVNFTTIPTELSIQDAFGEDIDPGQDVIPQLIDIDEDGDLDLLIGENNGNINFYKNNGTPEAYSFELVDGEFGGVWVDNLLGLQGNNVSHFYKDNEGDWALLTGNELGTIHRWNDIENNLEGSFFKVDSALADINDGQFSAPFVFDINSDGYQDIFVGNERGGVTLYLGQFVDNIDVIGVSVPEVKIYPNPNNGLFTVSFSGEYYPEELLVYNSLGKLVKKDRFRSQKIEINLEEYSAGLYFLTAMISGVEVKAGKVLVD